MGLASPSSEVFNEMLAKHPQADPPSISSDTFPTPLQVSREDMLRALKSFPTGSAPGPSSLRANHIKQAIFCPSPDPANKALQSLTGVINLLCAGKVPPDVIPYLCGALLLPCLKKNGGLRPIAVGEVLRRLTSKCVTRAVLPEANNILSPLQVGVGLPGGCEAIVHSVVDVLDDHSIPPDHKHILMVDFSNAFNSVSRKAIFDEVRAHIPSITAWMECSYGSKPILLLGDQSILSCCRVQQGDPLGPLDFSLALHPIVRRIKDEVPGLLINTWFLDDSTLCGSPEDLSKALSIIESEGPPNGLFLNRAKSLIFAPPDSSMAHALLQNIPTTSEGFALLRSPIGPANFCESNLSIRINKIREALSCLGDLQDSQMETTLLRSCLTLPKLAYILRCCPPALISNVLNSFDGLLHDALSDLVGSPLPDWAWLKASLPSSSGGVGIRHAVLYAPAAYIGSFFQSQPLISSILGRSAKHPPLLAMALDSLRQAAARPDWVLLQDIDVPLTKLCLSRAIDEASFDFLLASAPDTLSRVLALSSAIHHAADWLNVVPSPALGLSLQDREFCFCLQYWLGLQMFEDDMTCPVCHSTADCYGDHQVGCGANPDQIHRHNFVRDALFSAAQSAALAPRREVPSLIPGTQSRPADVFLPNWSRGHPAALDITNISPLQHATLQGAALTQGHALLVGEARKYSTHGAPCHSAGITFVPVTFEALGGMRFATNTVASIG